MTQIDRDIHLAKALVVDGNPTSRSVMAAQLRDLGVQQIRQLTRVQDAPVAADAQVTTGEDSTLSSTLPVARDADGDPITYTVTVERERARFSSWYEFFPRSAADGERHGTFADCEAWLPYVQRMGSDVLYFPPIHPIGRTRRMGWLEAVRDGIAEEMRANLAILYFGEGTGECGGNFEHNKC